MSFSLGKCQGGVENGAGEVGDGMVHPWHCAETESAAMEITLALAT